MTPKQRQNFARLLAPRHLAVIGGRDAETVIFESLRAGFGGAIWPVNPKRKTLSGYPCFARVEDLPEAPDATFIAIPADRVINVVAQLNAMGAGGVVCYSAGYAETDEVGAGRQRALVAAAGDLALIGPNCYGLVNYLDSVALWPFSHGGHCPGYGAAIITQSGMMSSDITMSQRSLPLTHMISAGNQAGLQLEDFVDGLCEKPEVRVIGMHIEGIRDVQGFINSAYKALQHNTPIVVLKTGTSRIGANLTRSHTGLLSGEDDLYQALFAALGIIRVFSVVQLLETLKFIAVAGIPAGERLVGFTCSGGGATLLADYAETIGLELPPFAAEVNARLRALLPPIATVSNPLDYTTPIWGNAEKTAPVFRAAMGSGAYDAAVIIQDFPHPEIDREKPFYLSDTKTFIAAAWRAQIPAMVCATLPENIDLTTREMLVAEGVAPMQGLPEALNAVRAAMHYYGARAQILARQPLRLCPSATPLNPVAVDEWQGKRILQKMGLGVVPGAKIVRSIPLAELQLVTDQIGTPLVLKMLNPAVAHKTEIKAVRTDLQTAAAVLTAMAQMQVDVARHRPQAVTDDFLLEAMLPPPLAELMVSLRRDPQFGMVLVLASGGVFVELFGDAVTLLVSNHGLAATELRAALGRLKIAPLLGGFRGADAAAEESIIQFLQRLIAAVGADPRIIEVEINPLFILRDGVAVVDVALQVADPHARPNQKHDHQHEDTP